MDVIHYPVSSRSCAQHRATLRVSRWTLVPVCAEPGCPELVPNGRCPAHQRARQNQQRRTSIRRSYGADWPTISRRYRHANPTCECADPRCGVCAGNCTMPSEHVDHVTPLEFFTDRTAAHDPTNLQALCRRCHASKSARLDVRFGRP